MKYRIQEFTSRQRGRVYRYQWFGYSYRDEKTRKPTFKCLVNLTGLPEDLLARLRSSLADGNADEPCGPVQFLGSMRLGPEAVGLHILETLGIDRELSVRLPPQDVALVKALVLDRVLQPFPHSRKSLFENLPGSPLARVCGVDCGTLKLASMYYALDHLRPLQDGIERGLFRRNGMGQSRMYLYDITSSYFEGDACPLEAFGYNRDGKKGKKQIVIGMLCSRDGCPVGVEVFEGNTSDQTTVMGRVDSMRRRFGIDELVFIGDRGMLTRARRGDLSASEYEKVKYVTALSREEFVRFVEDGSHPLQLTLFDRQNLAEVPHDGVKHVLSYNPELEERNRADRERLMGETEKFLDGIKACVGKGRLRRKDAIARRLYRKLDKWKCGKFYEIDYDEGKFDYRKKEELAASYANMDGFYVFVTDKLDLTAEETREEYRGLQRVEQVFRTMKTTDLHVRPIRLWNPERVRAHVFVCMLAYMVVWKTRRLFAEFITPEDELRVSLRTQWEKLEKVEIGRIRVGDAEQEQLAPVDGECRELLKAAGLTPAALAKRYLKTP